MAGGPKSGRKRASPQDEYKTGDCIRVAGEDGTDWIAKLVDTAASPSKRRKTAKGPQNDWKVLWFYKPEDAKGGRKAFHGAKELYSSNHEDDINPWCIKGHVQVHKLEQFVKLPRRGEDDYFTRFQYDFHTHEFEPEEVEVFCTCSLPYNPDVKMIVCPACHDWSYRFHPQCVSCLQPQQDWRCPNCSVDDSDNHQLDTETKAQSTRNRARRLLVGDSDSHQRGTAIQARRGTRAKKVACG